MAAHDVIVTPFPTGGEIYSMSASLFASTYQLDPQSQIPTGEKLLAQWAEILQKKVVYDRNAGVANTPLDSDTMHVIELNVGAIAI